MAALEKIDDVKLLAWISVYTNSEKQKEYGIDSTIRKLTKTERIKYIKFLYENCKDNR